jgi:hypothetical protein
MRQLTQRGRDCFKQITAARLDQQTSRLYKTPLLSKELSNKSSSESNKSSQQRPGQKYCMVNKYTETFICLGGKNLK